MNGMILLMKNASGIYLIKCQPPGRLPSYYVGQSKNVRLRCDAHRSTLRHGRHVNAPMQRHWDKYGEAAFSFEALDYLPLQDLDAAELWWISEMIDHRRCFNIGTDPVAPHRGRKFSDDHKHRISAATSGENHYAFGSRLSAEHRASISKGGRGVSRSDATKARIALANQGERNSMFGKSGRQNAKSRAVVAVSADGMDRRSYESATLAERDGFDQGAISRVCNGRQKAHLGFIWSFA